MILLVVALASADCADCHPREAAAMARSRHATAATLPVFTQPLRAADRPVWCASCHRPEGPKTTGLECLSCHRVAGDPDAIRSSRLLPTTATRAHKTIVDASFAISSCATCHEFKTPLPDHLAPVKYSDQPLQSTVSELRATDPRATCAGCHDVHRANGAHDPELVRSAAAFTARAAGDGVEVIVEAGAIGHRFPTGDPFRRIVISVCDDPACEVPIERQTIARRFAFVGPVWAPVVDRTLRDRERRVLRFRRARYFRAQLYFGDPRFERRLPASEIALELARGTVAGQK